MKAKMLLALAGLSIVPMQAAAGQALTPPVAANAYITIDGLDWAWASPCALGLEGSCTANFVLVDGFRFATPAEFALRPAASAFLDPFGNFTASGGEQMRCASAWFNVDPAYTHCDFSDGGSGLIASGPENAPVGFDGLWETFLVRDGNGELPPSVVPEPATYALMGTGLALIGLVGRLRGRKRSSSEA